MASAKRVGRTKSPPTRAGQTLRHAGQATVVDTWGLGKGKNRAPNGDYLLGIVLKTTFPGRRPKTSRRIHHVPKNRVHLLDAGTTYPVTGDPDDHATVAIDWANYQRIDGRKVLDRILTRLGPTLRAAGFRKATSRAYNRTAEDGLVHIVDFQASSWGDGFTINVAVFVRELRRGYAFAVDERRLVETDCTPKLRWRIGELRRPRGDHWWPYVALEETAESLSAELTKYVFPHLAKYASRTLLHAGWRKGATPARTTTAKATTTAKRKP